MAAALVLAFVAACTPVDTAQIDERGVFDPYEQQNRKVHRFNVGLDRTILRPAGNGYVSVVPQPVQTGVGNLGSNLSEPSSFVNHVLQADMEGAGTNFFRFLLNSTLGIAGLFDVASAMGIPEDESDFGETLHVWGAPEGAYVELPALGPSNERDATGKVVDLFTDPLSYVLPKPEKYLGTAARAADAVGSRGRFADTVDSVLYDSADSYAQARLFYLQNRRFELGIETEDTYIDPDEIDTEGF